MSMRSTISARRAQCLKRHQGLDHAAFQAHQQRSPISPRRRTDIGNALVALQKRPDKPP
jgi:hypothetical protein